jgi:Flp pilus assembly protein TadD
MKFLVVIVAMVAAGCVTPISSKRLFYDEAWQMVEEGVTLLEEGELKKADAKFRMAEALAPSPEAYEGLGCVAHKKGEFERAEHLFLLIRERYPEYGHVLGNLALLEVAKGDLHKAQQYFEEALKQAPDDYKARANYATFLKHLNLPGAEKIAEEAVAQHAEDETESVLKFVRGG